MADEFGGERTPNRKDLDPIEANRQTPVFRAGAKHEDTITGGKRAADKALVQDAADADHRHVRYIPQPLGEHLGPHYRIQIVAKITLEVFDPYLGL